MPLIERFRPPVASNAKGLRPSKTLKTMQEMSKSPKPWGHSGLQFLANSTLVNVISASLALLNHQRWHSAKACGMAQTLKAPTGFRRGCSVGFVGAQSEDVSEALVLDLRLCRIL